MKQLVTFIFFSGIICCSARAQITANDRTAIVDSMIVKLNRFYVFPEVAKKMELHLQTVAFKKQSDTIRSADVYATFLSRELFKITNDKHLHVTYSAGILPAENNDPSQMPEGQNEQYAQWLLSENYGINKLAVLPGNIGYIDFKWFCGPEYAGDTYAAAMNYVAHTSALIIDLRNSNGAMSMYAIPFICSYFFAESTHLNDFYWREKNETIQTWTQAVVPGKKYLDKPIYILTSAKTFSGAEEFAYDLKNLKRATLIGETTGGGANGGGTVRLNDHFEIFIPSGRAINPITKTNWEGIGVAPDTAVKSNRALYAAQMFALQHSITKAKDGEQKLQLQQQLTGLLQNPPAFKKLTFSLPGFKDAKEVYVAGSFNNWSDKADKLQRKGNFWTIDAETEPGEITYKFIVDGQWILDPNNKETKTEGGNTNSLKKL